MQSISVTEAQHSIPAPLAGHISVRLDKLRQITIFCYEKEVPPFAEYELDRLYENFFSTLSQCRESGNIENASTYVVFERGAVTGIFLFAIDGREVRVLNEVIKIDQDAINQFSNHIFSAYGSVNVISFHAVDALVTKLHRPFQRINCLEDIVLSLPNSPEMYLSSLGKSTRKTIKNYSNKLKREFPTFTVQAFEKGEAGERDIRAIIQFNRTRLLSTGRVSAFDDAAVEKIVQFVKQYGLLCIATIDGKICAGSISYRVGNNYFMHVSAHDSIYDNFRLGVLFRYLTICECIRRGGRECHFLWGRQEFKFSLLGVQRDLHDIVIYRSRLHFLLRSSVAIQHVYKGLKRQTQLSARTWRDRTGIAINAVMKFLSRLGMLGRSA